MSFGTFNLADIAMQAEQVGALRDRRAASQAEAQARQAEAERAAMREQAGMIAKLTEGVQDDATYQQRRQAALAYGMDPSAIPETYDPQFVSTYNTLATTLLRPDGEQKLTTTAQELRDAGYQPGTPEFIQAMRQRLEIQDSKVISTQAGGMASLLGYGGQIKPVILPNDGGGTPGGPAMGGGNIPTISSPEEAKRLPPGTQFRTPDGRIKRVPGGPASAPGGFPGGY